MDAAAANPSAGSGGSVSGGSNMASGCSCASASNAPEHVDGPCMCLSTSEIVEIVYQLVFCVIGTPINICALIATNRRLRSGGVECRLVRLTRHLLIAHIMVLVFYGLWRSYWIWNIIWVHGDIACRLFSFLSALPFSLWSNLVAAVAIDMLSCIRSPLSSYRATRRVSILIAAAWIWAIVCNVPMLILRGTVNINGKNSTEEWPLQCYALVFTFSEEVLEAFQIFHMLTVFYLPFIVITACYTLIGASLWRRMDERKRLHRDSQTGSAESRRSATLATKWRFAKASFSIVATFVITWLPYQLFGLSRLFCKEGDTCDRLLHKLYWLQAIVILSTCITPFLYRFDNPVSETKRRQCSTLEGSTRADTIRGRTRSGGGGSLQSKRSVVLLVPTTTVTPHPSPVVVVPTTTTTTAPAASVRIESRQNGCCPATQQRAPNLIRKQSSSPS